MPDTDQKMQELAERQRAEAIESQMIAEGVSPTEEVYEDYFGFEESSRVNFPDGRSWVEFKVMNEGARRQYLNAQNKKITIRKGSGDAEMELTPGDDKYNLLRLTIVNWNLRRNGQPVVFNKHELDRFLTGANPKIIDLVHRAITLAHPWLLDDMTVEDIDAAIDDLKATREVVVRRESGK